VDDVIVVEAVDGIEDRPYDSDGVWLLIQVSLRSTNSLE